ncbi:transporter substrate-binding domain-containing protein [Vibrio metschnikovii]|uniref:transporter substrate-binding domain-containing protein n=1 Tax=Vibrio metschnikovii TaxID=28172 RepID=UPI001C2FB092|nr:transporter substrate-binding domain-containing protein [Vibrio metschnikovii]
MRFLIFFNRFFIYLLLVFISVLSSSNATEKEYDKNEIIAHLGEIPGLINADGTGPFVDLVRRIDAIDPNVNIIIHVYPLHRAIYGVVNGQADFALPAVRVDDPDDKLAYRFSSRSFGLVASVLYTNKDKPFSVGQLWAKPNHYIIEAFPDDMPFPVMRSNSINTSLLKLSSGRIDGFVWAQEEADIALRSLNLTNIYRQHFYDHEDVFIIPKGPKGDWIDDYLTRMIDKLKESGELEAIYKAIHLPYDDWQF